MQRQKIKVLTCGSELKSARNLGFPTSTELSCNYKEDLDDSIIIRWGNSSMYYNQNGDKEDFKQTINSAKAIRRNCRKHLALRELAKVVKTPALYCGEVGHNKKVVIRPEEHTGGKDFSIKNGPLYLDDGTYAVDFIETDKEFRVWFCGDKTFCCRRVPLNQEHEKQAPCRAEWGYRYIYDIPPQLHKQTLAAAKALNIEVGAADVLWDGKSYYFLELNTAPSLDAGMVISFYKENIRKLIESKFKIAVS